MKNAIKTDFLRAFGTKKFFLTVIVMFCVWQINSLRFTYVQDVMYAYVYTKGLSITTLLAMVVASSVYCSSYSEECEHDLLKYFLLRITKKQYIISKIVTCFVSAFAVSLLGSLIFVLFQSFSLPVIAENSVAVSNFKPLSCFGDLLPYHPWIFIGLQIVMDSLCCSCISVFALAISTFIPNIYVALALPMILYYFLYYFFGYIVKVPDMFQMELTFRIVMTYVDNKFIFMGYAGLVIIVYVFVSVVIMNKNIERKFR